MFATSRLQCGVWLTVAISLPTSGISLGEEPRRASNQADLPARIQQLVEDLNANDFSSRQLAQEQLVDIGLPALAALHRATGSKSPEQRYRARVILRLIRRSSLRPAFAELGRRADDRIDVEEGMWLISCILDPATERADLSRQLDEMANAVRKQLGPKTKPADAAPRDVIEAIRHVLGTQFKLTGSVANYDHPDNSSLHRVLKQRKGLPILLSHIAVSVAERLDVPIVGIGVPSRYMVKYDGAKAPKGFAKEDIIMNPFDAWQVLSVDEVSTVVPSFRPTSHLVPSTPRETLSRMLRNLASDYVVIGQPEMAAEVEMYRLMVETDSKTLP